MTDRRRSFFKSLRFKLIATAIVVEVVLLSLLVWNSMRLTEQSLTEQMEHRMNELQPLLNASLSGPLLQEDIVSMQDIMQQYQSDDVLYYAVYNSFNELMVTRGKPVLATEQTDHDTFGKAIHQRDQDIYYIHMPIKIEQRVVGHLDLEISLRFIQQAVEKVWQQGVLIALAEILLSTLLLSIIGLLLTRHLSELTRVAHLMSQGDLSARAKVSTHDEIGEAAATFNRMADNISKSQQQLLQRKDEIRKLNAELEQRVETRTQELSNANTRLEDSLSELQKTQSQLVQSEKMAALGGLVAGVAHEINTPIGLGVTTASYLQEKVQHLRDLYERDEMTRDDFERFQDAVQKSATIISSNLQRSATLIQSFKKVAVDQASEDLRSFGVCEYLDDIIKSLSFRIRKSGHQVKVHCEQEIRVNSYPGALAQIITNLVDNALIHAFSENQNGDINIHVSQPEAGQLLIDFCDNGVGMDEETVHKIFDPFFTTRRGDGGSGLGMHIVYNLVTQTFNGSIECESSSDGSCFRMRLQVES